MPTYNALRYTQSLEEAGFTRPQAEAAVKLVLETMDDLFATKSDLKESQFQLRQEFQELRVEFQGLRLEFHGLRTEFQELRAEVRSDLQAFRHEMRELESRMTIRLGAMMISAIAIMQFLQK